MLKVSHIDAYYDKVHVLHNVSLEVGGNEIISLIGSNGAGKSTLMKTIIGLLEPKNGKIEFMGEDITKAKSTVTVAKGIVYVPEGREVFPEMTVRDNLEMGAFSKNFSAKEMSARLEEIYSIFPRLKERHKQLAGSLSGGEQQMLAIGRGLMSDPKLLMLDEPSLGLAPVIVEDVFKVIVDINKTRNIPILLVEQNAFIALNISSRCYVLENGSITLTGPSKELIDNDDIRKSYLGEH